MDLFLLFGIAVSLLGVIVSFYFFQKKRNAEIAQLQTQQQRGVGIASRLQEGIPRRAQILRNQRNRLRDRGSNTATNNDVSADQGNERNDASDDDDGQQDSQGPRTDEKLGAKKRAKLEAKAEKRAQRETELQMREERKKKEAAAEEQRKIQEQQAENEERKQREAERLAREEKERKEYEEYLKIKEAFSIEEEGFEEADDAEQKNLLQEFIQHIKDNKVVVLEDVASHFKMKTQQVIDRIGELRENGSITGVIDDRGKFIYISEDELESVAKFIKQRGRVSIVELAESSNNLINLSSICT